MKKYNVTRVVNAIREDVQVEADYAEVEYGVLAFYRKATPSNECGLIRAFGKGAWLEMKEAEFNFPTDLWARVLFDMAISYRDAMVERDLMMDSLIPLYFGRSLSFVKKTERMSIKQAEEAIEEDCSTFEMTKPYLLHRWKERSS